MNPIVDRRAQLRQYYGFEFPDDLFQFWELAKRLRPLEPLAALSEGQGVHLVGPFDILAGRFDGRMPRLPCWLHWRYYQDPPEFFTVLYGGEGQHWGYYFDNPGKSEPLVVSYQAGRRLRLQVDGTSLFEAVRYHLECCYRDTVYLQNVENENEALHEENLRALHRQRSILQQFATGDRAESGGEYEERYPPAGERLQTVVAKTADGIGIVADKDQYRPLSIRNKELWRELRIGAEMAALIDEARQALAAGFPATALKLGKDLWALGGDTLAPQAFELLHGAYLALERNVLADVLEAHHQHRNLPSVDILENDIPRNGSV